MKQQDVFWPKVKALDAFYYAHYREQQGWEQPRDTSGPSLTPWLGSSSSWVSPSSAASSDRKAVAGPGSLWSTPTAVAEWSVTSGMGVSPAPTQLADTMCEVCFSGCDASPRLERPSEVGRDQQAPCAGPAPCDLQTQSQHSPRLCCDLCKCGLQTVCARWILYGALLCRL